ncbi:MAG: purple acid phosphatase family protein [Nitrososphaerales archaeon]
MSKLYPALTVLLLSIPLILVSSEVFLQPPMLIHLSTEGDPSTTVTVTWKTRDYTQASTVEYGQSTSYDSRVTGVGYTYYGASGVLHRVKIDRLKPDTLYHYRVGDPVGGWSSDHTFRTAPTVDGNFTFTVYGDQGTSTYSRQNAIRASALKPSFHIHTGDLSYSGGFQSIWDQWFEIVEPLASSALYMPAIGNHEFEGGLNLYLDQFSLPGNERWYSFNWGNAHFVSIEVPSFFRPEDERYGWLVRDLEAASRDGDIDWITVYFHFPPYSSGPSYPGFSSIRSGLTPILERYRVDLVLNGHDHIYQRTFPLYNGSITSSALERYTDPEGIIYVVTGGGGRSLYGLGKPEPPWSAKRASVYHFLQVSIEGGDLHLKAIKADDGSIIDEFHITKTK